MRNLDSKRIITTIAACSGFAVAACSGSVRTPDASGEADVASEWFDSSRAGSAAAPFETDDDAGDLDGATPTLYDQDCEWGGVSLCGHVDNEYELPMPVIVDWPNDGDYIAPDDPTCSNLKFELLASGHSTREWSDRGIMDVDGVFVPSNCTMSVEIRELGIPAFLETWRAGCNRFHGDKDVVILGLTCKASVPVPGMADQPAPCPQFSRTLRKGASGEDVRRAQDRLRELGYHIDVDGVYGSMTEGVVTQFQRDNGIGVDGVLGPQTAAKLCGTTSAPQTAPAVACPGFTRTLRRGASGDDVRRLQQRLHAFGYTIDIDGEYGPMTEGVVTQFQRDNGLQVDGIFGPQSAAKLCDLRVPR